MAFNEQGIVRDTAGRFDEKPQTAPEVNLADGDDGSHLYQRLSDATNGLTLVGPTGDVAGYTYQAENYKPDELVETLIEQGRLAPGARGMDPDEAIDQMAAVEGVDREDEYSFDSDDFPKVILGMGLTIDDLDWLER